MTVIAALKADIGGKTYVVSGSDSRVSAGGEILPEVKKFVLFPNFLVMSCGIASINYVIRQLTKDNRFLRENCCKMRDLDDAVEFAQAVYSNLKILLESSPDPNSGNDSRILIASRDSIYDVDQYLYGFETDAVSQGSGGAWAQSILEFNKHNLDSVEEMENLMTEALRYAVSKDTGCGGKLNVQCVTTMDLPPQPVRRKIIKRKKPDHA